MSKRTVLLLVAIGVAGWVVISSLGGGRDLEFVAPAGERSVVDVGDTGPSLGDMTVFSGNLLKDGDDEAGRLDGVCTVTSSPGDDSERRQRCAVTLTVGDGETEIQLAAVGRVEAGDVLFSVVGGTKEFRDAAGEALFDYSDPERTRITVALDD
jgi:hypothetical protein